MTHKSKKQKRARRKFIFKRMQCNYASCIGRGAGYVHKCTICLGLSKVGKTRKATLMDINYKKECT